jgi:Protein of unknown function (DUF1565)
MKTYYVSISGDDDNPGTKRRPFRTVAQGIKALRAEGDVLLLRAGHYVEAVRIEGKHGTAAHPIVIRSYGKEHATIDGCLSPFLRPDNDEWVPATGPGTNEDEYVSRATFALRSGPDAFFRGAFLEREPYTRLISYSVLEDLRAENETWDINVPITDPREGLEVADANPVRHKRPLVYMGPGFFVSTSPDEPAGRGRIHIRLSHTHNGVRGLAEYEGETDPRKISLAICPGDTTTLTVSGSSFVRLERLSIRFGGATTVKVEGSADVVFDHVRVMAAAQGIGLTSTTRVVLRHCEVRGGIPSWFFRSDRKNEYKFRKDGAVFENVLGKRTSRVLLDGTKNIGLEIHHCEFVDGHDLALPAPIRFHHNWVHNLNDEALIVDEPGTDDVYIFENVITQCLSGISFARDQAPAIRRRICRNLFDLRNPTASRRPGQIDREPPLRFGHLYKGGATDGSLDFFQNTCLVRRVTDRDASYTHYQNTIGTHPRRSFNNIFIAVNPDEESDRAVAILPPSTFPAQTDGNCYFRIGSATKKLLLVQRPATRRFDLDEWRNDPLFIESRVQYPPGYEAAGRDDDPRFRRIAPDGTPRPDDDIRLRADSVLRRRGIDLGELRPMDPSAPPPGQRPNIGCCPFGAPPLRVGVDGRRRFPESLQPLPPTL